MRPAGLMAKPLYKANEVIYQREKPKDRIYIYIYI